MTNKAVAVPEISVARYAAPRVSVTAVTEMISSEPIEGRRAPGHYQGVLLDVATGELRLHENTEHLEPWLPQWKALNDVPRETLERWYPGSSFTFNGPHMWFEPVPQLLSWGVDSGSHLEELHHLDAAAANAMLEELAPYAQALLDNLFEAGGELDWSADSARAGRNIGRLCSRHREAGAPDADGDLVDFAVIVQRFPQVYKPEWLRLSLDQLAEECEMITRFLGSNEHWHPDIKKVFGRPAHLLDGSGVRLETLGVRAWYRTVLLDGDPRPVREFSSWDAEYARLAAGEITSSSTDAELDEWVEHEEARAAQANLRLLGAADAAYNHRTKLREQDWDRLAVIGAEVTRLERELAEVRVERQRLVTKAISWGQSDSAIADRGRMTRQAVHKHRTAP